MPLTRGINHVATFTADLDRLARFYLETFGAEKRFEVAATGNQPRMAIIDLGGSGHLKVYESAAVVAVRHAPIDHFGLAVDSLATLRGLRERMVASGTVVGDIERLPTQWLLSVRNPDGAELFVCAHVRPDDRVDESANQGGNSGLAGVRCRFGLARP